LRLNVCELARERAVCARPDGVLDYGELPNRDERREMFVFPTELKFGKFDPEGWEPFDEPLTSYLLVKGWKTPGMAGACESCDRPTGWVEETGELNPLYVEDTSMPATFCALCLGVSGFEIVD